jgi:hypothetical protein
MRPPLWNVALSITTTCPIVSVGRKQLSSQVSFHCSITRPLNSEGSYQILVTPGGNHVYPSLAPTWFQGMEALPFIIPTIIILISTIHP